MAVVLTLRRSDLVVNVGQTLGKLAKLGAHLAGLGLQAGKDEHPVAVVHAHLPGRSQWRT